MVFSLLIHLFLFAFLQASPTYTELYERAYANQDYAISTRRYLHQYPELSMLEYKTSQFIKDELTSMGINYTDGWGFNNLDSNKPRGGTGVVAEIGTGKSPCVALRADIDALPISEAVNLPFKSKIEGTMHACGHDGHTAMLLGAAKILKELESELQGTVRLLFQPGEEGHAGAKFMCDEGALSQYPPAERVFGFHISPSEPTGYIATAIGPSHNAVDDFTITVKGKGGHAGMHHLTIDPITAAMAIIRNIYDIAARELYFQVEHAGVISVGVVKGGEGATNVIPDEFTLGGTIWAPKDKTLFYLKEHIFQNAREIAHTYRCEIEMKSNMLTAYKALENNEEMVKFSQKIFKGQTKYGVNVLPIIMGGEDFSFFADEVPGAFLRLGIGSGAEIEGHVPTDFPIHRSSFALDERIIPQGVAMHCHLAFQSIDEINKANQSSTDYSSEL